MANTNQSARNEQTVVIAHGPCSDGRTAAWTHWRSIPDDIRSLLVAEGGVYSSYANEAGNSEAGGHCVDSRNPSKLTSPEGVESLFAKGIPVAYAFMSPVAEVSESLVRGRNVILLDISLEKSIRMIADVARSVEVCDHHESAQSILEELTALHPTNFRVFFDVKRSGAGIAWERFCGKSPAPLVVRYVEDRDLWKWKIPASREINEALNTDGHLASFGNIEKIHLRLSSDSAEEALGDLKTRGAHYLKYQQTIASTLAWRCAPVQMSSVVNDEPRMYNVLLVNSPTLSSEIGHEMLSSVVPTYEKKGWPVHFVAIWFYHFQDDKIIVSVRSSRPEIDLSLIAKAPVGGTRGGGHHAAAGFAVPGSNIRAVFTPRSDTG